MDPGHTPRGQALARWDVHKRVIARHFRHFARKRRTHQRHIRHTQHVRPTNQCPGLRLGHGKVISPRKPRRVKHEYRRDVCWCVEGAFLAEFEKCHNRGISYLVVRMSVSDTYCTLVLFVFFVRAPAHRHRGNSYLVVRMSVSDTYCTLVLFVFFVRAPAHRHRGNSYLVVRMSVSDTYCTLVLFVFSPNAETRGSNPCGSSLILFGALPIVCP